MNRNPFQHPAEIVAVIRRKPQFSGVTHDFPEPIEGFSGHNPALVMPAFRPGIGKQDEYTRDRCQRQRRNQETRIIGINPDIPKLPRFDFREQLFDSVFKEFAADKTDIRISFGLRCEVLASAKTNLKPNCRARPAEQSFEIERTRFRRRDLEKRQQQFDAALLGRSQGSAAAPSKKKARRLLLQIRRSEGAPQFFHQIQPLPGEAAVAIGRAPEMAVSGSAGIDRLVQAEMRAYAAGRQIH
jgi:hypothetical protein